MKNEIENIFKQKFYSFEATPSAGLFDTIVAKRAKKKRAIRLWGAAALLITVSTVGIWSYTTKTPEQLTVGTTIDTQQNRNTPTRADKSQGNINGIQETLAKTNQQDYGEEGIKEEVAITKDKRLAKLEAKTPGRQKPTNQKIRTNVNPKNAWANLFVKIDRANPNMDLDKGALYLGNKKQTIDKSTGLHILKGSKTSIPKTPILANTTEDQYSNPTLTKTISTQNTKATEEKSEITAEKGEDIKVSIPLPTGRLVALNKWRLQTSGGIGYASRAISETNKDYINLRNSTESVVVSYQFEANTIYQLSPKWNIQTGLQYTIRNELFEYSKPLYVTEEREVQRTQIIVHPILGEIERSYVETVTDTTSQEVEYTSSQNKFERVSIPIVMERKLYVRQNLSLVAKVGINAGVYSKCVGLLLTINNETQEYTRLPTRKSGINSAMIGLGVLYSITPRVSLLAYPQANLQLNSSTTSNAGFNQNDWGLYSHFGLRIGL
jgi:hypothetical protein